jgi:hypothetical protein
MDDEKRYYKRLLDYRPNTESWCSYCDKAHLLRHNRGKIRTLDLADHFGAETGHYALFGRCDFVGAVSEIVGEKPESGELVFLTAEDFQREEVFERLRHQAIDDQAGEMLAKGDAVAAAQHLYSYGYISQTDLQVAYWRAEASHFAR